MNQDRWDQLVQQSPYSSFLQSWAWGEMQAKLKVPFWRIGIPEHDEPQLVSLVFRRELPLGRSWLYIPRGPIFSSTQPTDTAWEAWQNKLQELARQEEALFVRCDPAWPESMKALLNKHDWIKASYDVQPRHTSIVDLTKSSEELLNSFHQKTRYNIRLAEKKGVTVRFSREKADIEAFLQLTHDVSARAPIRYHPDNYYRVMHQVLAATGLLEVGIAEHEGDILAVHILIGYGNTLTYAHGASSSQKRSLMAPHLLQWQSILRAKEQGYINYDLFGVAPPDAPPEHTWTGITRFKVGFSGQVVRYIGAYDLILDKAWYSAFSLVKRMRKLWH